MEHAPDLETVCASGLYALRGRLSDVLKEELAEALLNLLKVHPVRAAEVSCRLRVDLLGVRLSVSSTGACQLLRSALTNMFENVGINVSR